MSETTITICTRESCHLCEAAIKTCRRVSESVPGDITLDLVDVDSDPDLQAKFGDRVPYVLVDGRPAFKYRVNEAELRRNLRS